MNNEDLIGIIKKLVDKFNLLYNKYLEQKSVIESLKFKIHNLTENLIKVAKERNDFIQKFNNEVDDFNRLAENYNILSRQYKIILDDSKKYRSLYQAAKIKLETNDIPFNEYNFLTFGEEQSTQVSEQSKGYTKPADPEDFFNYLNTQN